MNKNNIFRLSGAVISFQQTASANIDTMNPTSNNYPRSNHLPKVRALYVQALVAAVVWLCLPGAAQAQTDVLSLSDSAQQSYTHYSFTLAATNTTTSLTAFFRQDPAWWALDDVSFTPVSSPGTEMVVNGGFESGDFAGWSIVGQAGLYAGGRVGNGTPGTTTDNSHSGSYYYSDGAVGGVDGIAQSFATTVGEDYNLNFWLANDGGGIASLDVFVGAQVSSYNGFPILYDGAPPVDGSPVVTPEPSTFALLGLGAFGMVYWARFRKTG